MRLWHATSVAIVVTLAGCSGAKLEEARNTQPTGDAFTTALYTEYTERAEHEYGYGNYPESDRFADKAIRAAGGENVEPMWAEQRRISLEDQEELGEARRLLMEALDASGRQKLPETAANAQVMWECWFEELEETRQPTHIDECKEGFWDSLNKVQVAVRPEPEPEPEPVAAAAPPPPTEPDEYAIYFDFDKSNIRADQVTNMQAIIEAAKASPDRSVHIIGRTDTKGPKDWNQALSERRTNQVIGALIEAGIDRSRISGESVGQTKLMVETADEVYEPANRVATVTLR